MRLPRPPEGEAIRLGSVTKETPVRNRASSDRKPIQTQSTASRSETLWMKSGILKGFWRKFTDGATS
jgi:hypothetical protein